MRRGCPRSSALEKTIERNAFVRMYVEQMLQELPPHRRHFTTVDMFLQAVNFVVHIAPMFKDVNSISWQFPLSALMNFWMMTPSGKAVLRMPQMNDHINKIMKAWCVFLDSPDSRYVLNETDEGWFCAKAYAYNDLDSYVIPDQVGALLGLQVLQRVLPPGHQAECAADRRAGRSVDRSTRPMTAWPGPCSTTSRRATPSG